MARQTGLLKIKGTLDNVTFYKSKDGDIAKMKTSVDAARIANDPAFARTRENGKEFGNSASAGKLLRDALRNITVNISGANNVARMTQIMTKVKNFDTTSVRGARNVGLGIANASAKALLKGFNFNDRAILGSILFKPFAVTTATGVITINGLIPANDIAFPAGATHINIKGAWAKVDFANNVSDIKYSNVVNLPINAVSSNVVLTPTAAAAGAGTNLFMLQIEFLQMVNTVQYSLKNGAYNALSVVEVA